MTMGVGKSDWDDEVTAEVLVDGKVVQGVKVVEAMLLEGDSKREDIINRPAHYTQGREYEPIAVIEDWQLGYHLGAAIKYISRAGRKLGADYVTDLEKAIWYLQREVMKAKEK